MRAPLLHRGILYRCVCSCTTAGDVLTQHYGQAVYTVDPSWRERDYETRWRNVDGGTQFLCVRDAKGVSASSPQSPKRSPARRIICLFHHSRVESTKQINGADVPEVGSLSVDS